MNETKKNISIVTVNFNQPGVTKELLDSIASHKTQRELELILVDNGSTTSPLPESWEAEFPAVTLIRSKKNTGFAGGNNIGIRQARGQYLFLVNNDTEFTPQLVDILADTLDAHPQVGMVSPKIRYHRQPDTLQYAGYSPMNYYTARNHCIGQFEKDRGQYDSLVGATAFAHGAAMMVRREAMEKAGLMKENYFLYYEELDWCESIRRAGYEIWVNMQALIYHKESVSVGKKSALKEYFMNRNRILFIRRNAAWHQRCVFYLYFSVVVAPRNILSYIREKQRGFTRQLLRAIAWNLTHNVNSADTGWKP
ncbi:glycosyltransferase family 2 protein [Sediminibacterium soli]|uniref:glycosyltransferase family 2 protein n=1 Tax=Sediminibacterium soli TaxID=2698829 RepID=UPI00137B7670|nr:glycosyltransferase family 2 protein [Sediminibacterium soli]NCI45559.1 glycosyltransferase family 2 protein [Sediminibacterium soli]